MEGESDKLMEKVLRNIEQDRQRTSGLLRGVEGMLQENPNANRDLNMAAAKYVETLQRSNEQLVKIVSLLRRNTPKERTSLSEEEKRTMFEVLEEG
jgi:hypothetical protein